MSTELALIDTIDTAKELAADRMDMSEILAKIESLIQVGVGVVKIALSGVLDLTQFLLLHVTDRNPFLIDQLLSRSTRGYPWAIFAGETNINLTFFPRIYTAVE